MNAFHIKGTIEAKAKNGAGIKIGEDWYSSFKGAGLQDAEAGDGIEFDWAPDKTGKWKNIDSKTIKVTKKAAAPASGGGGYVPKNNLGVELGHASKLAMDFTIYMDQGLDEWEATTIEIFQRMKRLRVQAEAGFAPLATETPVELDDDVPF